MLLSCATFHFKTKGQVILNLKLLTIHSNEGLYLNVVFLVTLEMKASFDKMSNYLHQYFGDRAGENQGQRTQLSVRYHQIACHLSVNLFI